MDIDIDGEAVVEGIMQSAGSAINAISGTLSREPSGLAKILIAYGPKSMRDWIIAGRFNLIQLKKQEEAFSLVCNTLVGHYKKLTTANKASKRRTLILSTAMVIFHFRGGVANRIFHPRRQPNFPIWLQPSPT